MIDVHELYRQLQLLDEQSAIEAKTGSAIGKSILETVCAYANEPDLGGGHLLLGVAQEEGPTQGGYHAVGVPDVRNAQENLASMCASAFNVPVRIEMAVEQIDGKQVLGVYVPEAQSGDKPVYFKSRGLPRGAFRRIGSSDIACTEDDLQVLYQARNARTFDATIIPDGTIDDFDDVAIEEYRSTSAKTMPDADALRWPREELLTALGCIAEEKGNTRPTIAGILLFGTEKALRRCFPLMRVDYIRVSGTEWIEDPERRFDCVEIRSPLMKAARRALAAVMDDIPKAFSLPEGQMQRRDIPLLPDRPVREAIVNAIMHRDYRVHGPVQIIRYSNRLEIRNPGYSLVSEERLGEPGSKSRNQKIAAVLHETSLAENKGSGIRIMRRFMEEANLQPPIFFSDRVKNEFMVTFLFHHFLDAQDIEWLGRFKECHLTDAECRALVFARETGAISNASYRDLCKIDTLSASVSLRKLRDAGLFDMRDKGPATYYVPTATLMESIPPKKGGLDAKKGGLDAKKGGGDAPSGESSSDISAILNSLAPGKDKPEKVRRTILDLCRLRPFGGAELAKLLKRQQKYLQEKYLGPMVREGLLQYTIPDVPSHERQAYRAASTKTEEMSEP